MPSELDWLFESLPTVSQLQAVRNYARVHGPDWRRLLLDDWAMERTAGELLTLRDQFGAAWLKDWEG